MDSNCFIDVPHELIQTLFDYSKEGDLTKIECLIHEHGENILSIRDEWGYTLAHWAALYGNVNVIHFLIHHKALIDVSCFGTQGPKPIHWACRKGHTTVIAVLLHAQIDINTADFKGLTPLMTACIYGRLSTCVFLLGTGAKHDLVDINGDTAAHWATYKGHAEIIRALINAGADLQKADNFGSTPLHLACIYGYTNCVRVLCQLKKLDLEIRDKNGKTPLSLARNHKHNHIVRLLELEIKKRSRYNSVQPLMESWNVFCQRFGKKNSKGPLGVFVAAMLLWCYPLYFLRVLPLTWNLLNGIHYCYLYWNMLMWSCWILSIKRDPGYLRTNTENYTQIIHGLSLDETYCKKFISFSQLCHTCRCIRPLRSKHCHLCNRCVAYFDHHCFFINNCVGIRNRTLFFMYLLCLAVNSSFNLYFCLYCLSSFGTDRFLIFSSVVSLLLVCFTWIRTAIALLHACMNITTNEMLNYKRYAYLRNKRGKYHNWFSKGLVCNLLEFFTTYREVEEAMDHFP